MSHQNSPLVASLTLYANASSPSANDITLHGQSLLILLTRNQKRSTLMKRPIAAVASALACSFLPSPAIATWPVDITEERETFWSGAMFGGIISICSGQKGNGLVEGAAEVLLKTLMDSTTAKYRYKVSGNAMWNAYRDGLMPDYPDCPIPTAD